MQPFTADNTFYFFRGRVAFYSLLRGLDLQPGDEVLIPAFTCVAVPSPILGMRAQPVYVDINPATYNLDPDDLERHITPRTKVILAQHTYGIPCDMDPIMAVARRHHLAVIEDACHVWGSKYKNKSLGSIGVAAFYSYDPGKPFIIGMGGAAVVNSEPLCSKVKAQYTYFRDSGLGEIAKVHLQYAAYELTKHPRLFWHIRDLYRALSRKGVAVATWTPDSFEGRLGPDYAKGLPRSLRSRLERMMSKGSEVIARHKMLAERYAAGLQSIGLQCFECDLRCEPVLLCYPLQVTNKTNLLHEARKRRVEIGDWFSSPVHPLPESQWNAVAYQSGSCPRAERVARHVVTLPCHAGVTFSECDRVIGFLRDGLSRGIFDLIDPVRQHTLQ
ncbi:MAG: DegT/DnrJ/EryC1/StrS family aminotransferase [Acidobacteriaceae bacterium]|nr:DegT/DnrJ/EryC1/StrS family aminotransferase [Acidobacteriaceae bacterium]MBV9781841.1 DegT/DnrJ/EryC1/StrS family aminotransferase [Acidobacteriaceae bacterium]